MNDHHFLGNLLGWGKHNPGFRLGVVFCPGAGHSHGWSGGGGRSGTGGSDGGPSGPSGPGRWSWSGCSPDSAPGGVRWVHGKSPTSNRPFQGRSMAPNSWFPPTCPFTSFTNAAIWELLCETRHHVSEIPKFVIQKYPGSIIAIRTVQPNDEVYMIGWNYSSTQLTSIKIHSKFNMTFMKTNRNPWKLELHETVHWSWRNHRIHRSLQIFTNHPYVYGHLSWFHMISMSFKWPATIITGQAVAVPIAPIVPIGQGAVTSWQLGRTWSTCSWGFGAICLG